MRKNLQTMLALLGTTALVACNPPRPTADYRIIPLPHTIQMQDGSPFTAREGIKICYSQEEPTLRENAGFLALYLSEVLGSTPSIEAVAKDADTPEGCIMLSLGLKASNPEAYTLEVNDRGIGICGKNESGVFYGIQTLRKSLPANPAAEILFPRVKISDEPRFPYRGMMLDVSRHFFTIDQVKEFIDLMALHNLNRFHWHLTDDQGWRIEIKRYPRLTEIGSQRDQTVIGKNSGRFDGKPHGGFYTQEQIREVVDYAAQRHITVVPEIDMPGHMQGALACFPELGCTGGPYEVFQQWGVSADVLCMGNPKTLEFVKNILEEVVELFPSEYIHIGGDECDKKHWKTCPKCQGKIRSLGLKTDRQHSAEERLQSYFTCEVERFLNARGRRLIGWDEILEGGLSPNATVMAWRGVDRGVEAARQLHDVIMTPTSHLYFDHYQSADKEHEPLAIGGLSTVERVYSFEPVPAQLGEEERRHILGTQANLWTEYIPTFEHVQYMILPRMDALSEVQWCAPEKKDYKDFEQRLPRMLAYYDRLGMNYARHILGVQTRVESDPVQKAVIITLHTMGDAPIHYTLDGSEPTSSSPRYTAPLKITQSATMKACAIRPSGKSAVSTEQVTFHKATMKPIRLTHPIDKGYLFDGEKTLVDGLRGTPNYSTGRWIAFRGNDLEAVIDLESEQMISSVDLSTCVEKASLVFDARMIAVEVSSDGEHFRRIVREEYPASGEDSPNGIIAHHFAFDKVEARYVKVIARPEYSMPKWHIAPGEPAFLFVDEIIIE